jgi:hypothetical protein
MSWLTSILGGVWGYVGAAAIAAALAVPATYWITSRGYQVTIATMQRDQAKAQAASVTASLDKLQSYIASMHQAGVDYGATQATLFARLDSLNREFRNAIKPNPLPADCRPDDVRVRELTAAIEAANTAAAGRGFGETLRTTH